MKFSMVLVGMASAMTLRQLATDDGDSADKCGNGSCVPVPWTVARSRENPLTMVCDASGIHKAKYGGTNWCPEPEGKEQPKEAKSADPPAKEKAAAAPAKDAKAAEPAAKEAAPAKKE